MAEELNIAAPVRQPLRVVLDSQLKTPVGAKILSKDAKCWLLTTAQSAENTLHAAENLKIIAPQQSHIDLHQVMQLLAEEQINLLHVEAGSRLCGALLQAQLVDEIIIYMAPVLMGNDAQGLFTLPGLTQMKDRVQLSISDVRNVGRDLRITAQPQFMN